MANSRFRRGLRSAALLVGFVFALGACSSNKVWVKIPPARDLSGYERIGLIEFTGNDATLAPIATREFQQRLHAAQPGVRIVELGEEAWVRGSVGATVLDGAAFVAIAEKHDVDAIFMGELAVENAVPRLDIMASLIQVRGSIDVTADLHVRLIEPRGGATVWSRSSSDSMITGSFIAASPG